MQGGICVCDTAEWLVQQDNYCCYLTPQADCPSDCSLANATQVGNGTGGGFVCEGSCIEAPDGEGAEDTDLHVFVMIENSVECQSSNTLLAYAISCGVDQCDRPVFGAINFCPSQLSTSPDDLDAIISTAVHELAHVLVFSNEHFRNFRNADGSPMVPRDDADPRVYQDEVRYSCNADGYLWNSTSGARRWAGPCWKLWLFLLSSLSEHAMMLPVAQGGLGCIVLPWQVRGPQSQHSGFIR